MKYRLFIALMVLGLTGCSQFLEEKSQSEIRPSTVTDMEKILEGDAYYSKAEGFLFNMGTDIFTDDWKCNWTPPNSPYTNKKGEQKSRFFWELNMFDESGGKEDLDFWTVPYQRIKGCNLVLDYIDGMVGDETRREHIRGEAHVLRGYYYLMLVNFFGLPYNFENPEQTLGVSLKLTAGVTDEQLPRESVAKVYRQIEQDLLTGASLMEEHRMDYGFTRVNHLAAYGLASRMYLYMEAWDKAIEVADKVLSEKPALLDLKSIQLSIYGTKRSVYSKDYADEILWAGLWNKTDWFDYSIPPYTCSDELARVYQEDVSEGKKDIRGDGENKRAFLTLSYLSYRNPETNQYEYLYYTVVIKTNDDTYTGGIRTGEVYLNRAEAYCRKYLATGDVNDARKALDDLNYLRKHRFGEGYTDKVMSDFAGADELLAFCLRERRRELCGEGNHRWFDLRRNGMPEMEHVYVDDQKIETKATLQEGDLRYALPIPYRVLERNGNLEQNRY